MNNICPIIKEKLSICLDTGCLVTYAGCWSLDGGCWGLRAGTLIHAWFIAGRVGCESRLLFVKIAMAIWCQVSGFRVSGDSKHVQSELF